MTPDEYVEKALRTESPVNSEMYARLEQTYSAVLGQIRMTVDDGTAVDALKRYVFYGKNDKMTEGQRQAVINSAFSRESAKRTLKLQMPNKSDMEIDYGMSLGFCIHRKMIVRTLHALFGLMTETGELCENIEKLSDFGTRNPDGMDSDPFCSEEMAAIRRNVEEEIGDLQWYIAILCDVFNIRLGNALEANIRKLSLRYPEKFDADKAVNRDIAAEQAALESPTKEAPDFDRDYTSDDICDSH